MFKFTSSFFLVLLFGCAGISQKTETQPAQASIKQPDATVKPKPKPVVNEVLDYPVFPKSELILLQNACDAIEITFYDKGASMAFSEVSNTRRLTAGIDTVGVKSGKDKKSAYFMFVVNGDFYCQAELVWGEKKYFEFKKDKVIYRNKINKYGLGFLNGMMKQLEGK